MQGDASDPSKASYSFEPIGIVRTPFKERADAPRQAVAAPDVRGTIELFPGRDFEHALDDIASFSHLWILFCFHLNSTWRPKVLPPRSERKRGLFATRSPYRPNPIGMSAVKLERVEGLKLEVVGLDILDGTPVLDIKPYIAYADAIPDADAGWLSKPDPIVGYAVTFTEIAEQQLEFLDVTFEISLRDSIVEVLTLGPAEHPYRRIRRDGDTYILAVKDWRASFAVEGRSIEVLSLKSGYRPRELATNEDAALNPHRIFTQRFRS